MFPHASCRVAITIILAVICTKAALAETRTWTDSSGKHSVEAELVKVDDRQVTLKRGDGKVVTLAIRRLSAADQRYVRSQQRPRPNNNEDVPPPKFDGPKASGKIHGQDFVVEQTKFQSDGGILTLHQGEEFIPDLGVIIFLFLEEGESPEGRIFRVTGKEGFAVTTPHIHMKFKEPGGRMPESQMFMGGYRMELRFGKASKGVVPAWINLQLPDDSRSKIVGSFRIDLSGEPRLQGTQEVDNSEKSSTASSDTIARQRPGTGDLIVDIDKDYKYKPDRNPLGTNGQTQASSLSQEPWEELLKEPSYRSSNVLYGFIKLGNSSDDRFTFVLEDLDNDKWIAYFDLNNNEDLTDDSGPIKNQGTGRFASKLDFLVTVVTPSGEEFQRPYRLWFWVNVNDDHRVARFYSRCYYEGHVRIAGRKYSAAVFELRDYDALYKDAGLWIDLDGNGKLDRETENFESGQSIMVDGKTTLLKLEYP